MSITAPLPPLTVSKAAQNAVDSLYESFAADGLPYPRTVAEVAAHLNVNIHGDKSLSRKERSRTITAAGQTTVILNLSSVQSPVMRDIAKLRAISSLIFNQMKSIPQPVIVSDFIEPSPDIREAFMNAFITILLPPLLR